VCETGPVGSAIHAIPLCRIAHSSATYLDCVNGRRNSIFAFRGNPGSPVTLAATEFAQGGREPLEVVSAALNGVLEKLAVLPIAVLQGEKQWLF
jgi:hypothetical protein